MSDGLPQLDATLFPEQLVWLALSFALLYVLMAFVALPAVRRTQDKRGSTIAADLAAAQSANESARNMMAQYEKALADARNEAQATLAQISATAAKDSAQKQAEQQKQLSQKLAEAEARIATARDAAVRDVQAQAADLATAIVDKITKGSAHAA